MSSPDTNITSVLKETRLSRRRRSSPQGANVTRRRVRAARGVGQATTPRASGPSRRSAALVQAVDAGARLERAARQVVRRRQDQRQLQLPRPPPRRAAQEQGRHHLGRRAGRQPRADLSATAPRGLQVRQRAEEARHQEGRPRHHLHADDAGAGDRHARLRPHRRDALGRLRRLLAPRRSPTATTTPRRSWSSPPTAAGGAARSCRSRPTSTTPWRSRRRSRSASSSTAATPRST